MRMNLLFDNYSRMSLLIGYLTTSFAIGLLVYCFFKLLMVFKNKNKLTSSTGAAGKSISITEAAVSEGHTFGTHTTQAADEKASSTKGQIEWLEKKYEFLFEDYKDTEKKHFFFAYYLTAFNAIYILLIFSLQNVPVLQCFFITILALIFIMFPAIIKPFDKKIPAFLHFFQLHLYLPCIIPQFGTGDRTES